MAAVVWVTLGVLVGYLIVPAREPQIVISEELQEKLQELMSAITQSPPLFEECYCPLCLFLDDLHDLED